MSGEFQRVHRFFGESGQDCPAHLAQDHLHFLWVLHDADFFDLWFVAVDVEEEFFVQGHPFGLRLVSIIKNLFMVFPREVRRKVVEELLTAGDVNLLAVAFVACRLL